MADNLLDKASILLTPTAYNDGRMLSVKPNENLYGSELVTNGDFSQGTQDWTFNTNGNNQWSVVNEKAVYNASSTDFIITNNILTIGKKYLVSFDILDTNDLTIRLSANSEAGGSFDDYTNGDGRYTKYITANTNYLRIGGSASGTSFSIDNVSVKEDLSGDFTFSRSSAATRVNAQGLVENVQIISPELVSNGNFSQIGTEEVLNGDFSQEGSELITNGDFATDSDWNKVNATISGGKGNLDGDGQTSILWQDILTNGSSYKATFTVSDYNGLGDAKVINNNGISIFNITSNGTFTIYFQHSIASGNILFRAVSGAVFSIDNVSVKEVGQNWNLLSGWSIGDNEVNFIGSAYGDSVSQNNVSTFGKTYAFDCDLTNGSFDVKIGSNSYFAYSGQTLYITADNSGASDAIIIRPLSSAVTITNISVKEVGQDWTLDTGWSIGDDKVVATDVDSTSFDQLNILTAGKLYKITYTILDYVSGSVRFRANLVNGSTNSANGTYTDYIVSGGTKFSLQGLSNFNGSITNISVKEITDDTDIPRINYSGFSYQDTLGSELVVNGDFSVDSNWTKGTGWSISGGTANTDGTPSSEIRQNNVTSVGKQYKYSFTISNSGSGVFSARFRNKSTGTPILNFSNEGTYSGTFTSNGTFIDFVTLSGNTASFSIDNVSVKEVTGQEVVPDSGCGNWLLEPQSTNLVTYSEDFSQWTLGSNATLSYESDIVAPDGSLGVYRLTLPAQSSTFLLSNSFTGQNPLALSIYAKSAATNNDFNLFDGTTSSSLKTATSEWQRFDYVGSGSQLAIVNQGDTFITDIYIWGAQAEALSYATSYIPTNGAIATRLADAATNSGNATLINSTEGVLYAEMASLADDGTKRYISLSDGSNSNDVRLYFDTNGYISALTKVGGSTQAFLQSNAYTQTDFNKIAFKYKENDFALWIDGVEVATDNLGSVNVANTLNELAFFGNNLPFYGKAKALAVFKEALTDAELQSLTTQ